MAMKRTGSSGSCVGPGRDERGAAGERALHRVRPVHFRWPRRSRAVRPCGRGRIRRRPWRRRRARRTVTPSAFSVCEVALRGADGSTCAHSSPAPSAPACRSPAARSRPGRWHGRCAQLGHQIGGGRRNDDQIGRARQFDMAHLRFVGEAEKILVTPVSPRQCRNGKRGDELRRRPPSGSRAPRFRAP